MPAPILTTKLYIPPPRVNIVLRPRLIERLNEELAAGRKLTLVSASAGFGKTTLMSEWIAVCGRPAAWLSLDERDNDPARFTSYLIKALQTIKAGIGEGLLAVLQSPQPLQIETILINLLNEISSVPQDFVLALDDYHAIDSQSVDQALAFLIERQPPQMHLIIATREDPQLPLARLRARGQLTELRAADLRFTSAEAAEFLNQLMGLNLSAEDVTALEARTEGWIAGLQLAAISMQGHQDSAGFIKSFTGSHRFVLDYLIEEVLQKQSEIIQTFLSRTSILDRLCSPLCEAVLLDPSMSGQATLEYLEHANLFIVPLDNERRWYRYHHLFRDLLRKRLRQSHTAEEIAKLHIRASQWYEDNALEIEAFHHAVDANDIDRAERLMEGKGIPLHFRGALNDILVWLASLPVSVLDAKPLLQVRSATIALMAGQTTSVEEKIQAAENALEKVALDAQNRDLIGQLACARATLAVTRYQPEEIIIQARRALGYLLPENMRFRFTANWALAVAYHLQGNRSASMQSITEALSISQISASKFSLILATTHLGRLQELENWLYQAAETYQRALQLLSNQPLPSAHDAHLGLARIYYEWNDLDAASRYAQQSLQMAHQYDQVIDRYILSEIFIARITLATGDAAGAAALLTQTRQSANHKNFTRWLAEIAAVQVLTLIRQGQLTAAAELSQQYELPMSLARVLLAQRNTSAALVILESFHQQMEAKGWQDERLKALVLLAIAHHAHSDQEKAVDLLSDALTLAEPGGFIRLFVDEGESVRLLLCDSKDSILKTSPNLCAYLEKLLAAFPSTAIEDPKSKTQNLVDPLSSRELEVLQLIAQGFSNQEICKRLFLALDTVKGHNRRIFEKLQVKRRTEAIARARELGLL